jgi:hypothetical protein
MATRDEEQSSKRLAQNLKDVEKLLQNIRVEAARNANTFKDINEILKDKKTLHADIRSAIKGSGDAINSLRSSSKELSGFDKERLKNRKETEKLLKEEDKVAKSIKQLQAQILVIEEEKATQNKTNQKLINKQLEDLYAALETGTGLKKQFEQIREANEELNKKTEFFDKLASVAKDIPILGKGFGEFAQASKDIRDNFGSNAFMTGLGAISKTLGKAALVTVGKGLIQADNQITSLARSLSTSRANAAAFRGEMIDAAMKSGTPVKYLMEAVDSVNESLGTTGIITTDQAKQFYTLTRRMGISQQAANGLFEVAAATGKEFENFNAEIFGTVKALNSVEGTAVDVKAVMDDIGNMSAATTLTTSKFSGGLAKAAFTARKFGLEMSGLESIAGNLLDFESSISAELEAELLTGRQLNLENARMAALRGDMVGLAEELNKQNITAESFGKMNVLQQEAIAKSMGMSREEMAKMFVRQEGMAKVAEQLNDAKFMELSNEEQMAKIMQLSGQERIKALQDIGEEEMAQSYANITAADALANAADVMTNSFKGDNLNKTITQPLQSDFKEYFGGFSGMATMLKIMAGAGIAYYAIASVKSGLDLFKSFKGPKGGGGLMKGAKNLLFGKKVGGQFMKGGGGARYAAGAVKGGLIPMAKTGLKSAGSMIAKGASTAVTAGKSAVSGVTKAVTKTGAKAVGKGLLKKIPVVGALAGIGFGLQRAMKGDFAGALGEVASGAASIIPGVGTAASIAIDAGLAARDISKASQESKSITEVAGDVNSAADQSNKTNEQLLKENKRLNYQISQLLLKETNIIMDGAKVGSAIKKNTYNTA